MQKGLILKALLLLCCCLSVHLYSTAAITGEKKLNEIIIDVDLNQASVAESIKQIEQQTGLFFCLSEEAIASQTKKINFQKNKIPVSEALDFILQNTGLAYKESPNCIIIEKKFPTRTNQEKTPNSPPGSLRGRIVETETSEPLVGATIKILDTQLGLMTDLDGYYNFPRVPAGRYTIEVSYIGYKQELMEVRVTANKTATYDVKMTGDSHLLNEVVVSGIARTRSSVPHATERLVVQEIKGLSVVASGISSEQISRSADRNAAQAVQRVSGVSIVDDKFVIVRGLNPRYNMTYLNDNVAPSTEVNNRSFALDLIPSRVIDKIMVYKTASPENQADATGGVIKIYTKDAKAVKHFDIDFQLGYREGTSFNSDFLTYSGGSTDFLGFDDGTRALPSILPGYNSLKLADLKPSEYAQAFNPTLSYGKKTALPNMQMTVNYYDAWNLFGKTLSSLTSFSYKNDNSKSQAYKQEGSFYRSAFSTDKISNDNKNSNTVQLNLLQNFTFILNEKNKLCFKNFLLQQGIDATTVRVSHLTNRNELVLNKDITLSYNQRFLYAGNLGGEHSFGKGKHLLQWNGGYNFSRQETPDQRVIRLKGIEPEIAIIDTDLNWWARGLSPKSSDDLTVIPLTYGIISRLWSRNSEGVYNASLDYTYKVLKWFTIKTGTFHQWKKRTMSRRIYTVHEGNVIVSSGYHNSNYVDLNLVRFREQDLPNVWSSNYLNDAYSGLYVLDRTSGSDMYVGTEQNNSGYIAATLNPWKWIELHGGVRYEYNRQKIGAAIPHGSAGNYTGINKPVLIDHAAGLWLPSVNFSLKPTEKWVLRVAYGKTVNRAEFREVSPFKELDFENNTELIGNTDLVSATIKNYDLRLEFYPNIDKGDAISAGIFYKNISNPIERVNTSSRIESVIPSISYSNATSAVIRGIEVEVRKTFDFIPGALFRNLSFAGNASWIESKAEFLDVYPTDPVIRERPLQGQAPLLLNAGLYYDNAGWGSKIAFIYNYIGENIYAVGLGYKSNWIVGPEYRGSLIELPRQSLDFSYTQRIGKGLQMKFTVQNILDAKLEMVEDFNFTNKYEILSEPYTTETGETTQSGDNIASSYRPGRYFSLSLSYSF